MSLLVGDLLGSSFCKLIKSCHGEILLSRQSKKLVLLYHGRTKDISMEMSKEKLTVQKMMYSGQMRINFGFQVYMCGMSLNWLVENNTFKR